MDSSPDQWRKLASVAFSASFISIITNLKYRMRIESIWKIITVWSIIFLFFIYFFEILVVIILKIRFYGQIFPIFKFPRPLEFCKNTEMQMFLGRKKTALKKKQRYVKPR